MVWFLGRGPNLKTFVKGLSARKGIEKNLWVKKFIQKIRYSKDEIEINLYYKEGSEKSSETQIPSGRVRATAGKNEGLAEKNKVANGDTLLKMAPSLQSARVVSIILPNTIHKCRKKNV